MCSGSDAGSYLRLVDFVYHPTLSLRVIKKKKKIERLTWGTSAVKEETSAPRSSIACSTSNQFKRQNKLNQGTYVRH